MLSTWHSVTHETGKGKKDSPREAREVCDLGTELGTLCSRVPHITLKIICKENQTIPKQQRDQLCRATCSTDSDPGPEYGLLRPGLFVQSDLCHMERLDQGFSTCRVQTNKQTNKLGARALPPHTKIQFFGWKSTMNTFLLFQWF